MKFFNIENLILNRIRAIPAYQRVALALWDMESYKQDIIFNKIRGLYRATSMESCVKSITESRYLLFNYRYHNVGVGHHNLGDYVQTIATRNALEYVLKGQCGKFEFWDRDSLSFYGASASKKRAFCVMQGWFSHSNNFLPSKQVIPVYLGTHLSQKAQELIQRVMH